MPVLAADPVIVTPAQREALEALVRAHSTSQQLALRAGDDVGVRESAWELDVRCDIGASGGGRRQLTTVYSNGWPMHRVAAPLRHTPPSRFAR